MTKECFSPQLLSDTLAVDLLNKTPKRYEIVRMAPARSRVTLRGGPDGADVLVDGANVARLPASTLEACPGVRAVAVSLGGRVVWQQTVEMDEGREQTFEVTPRPNVVLVETEEWPSELAEFGKTFNEVGHLDRPRDADLATKDGWTKLRFPSEVDLAFGVVPARRQGAADRWYLYSPILRQVIQIEAAPPLFERPEWSIVTWGFAIVDTAVGGTMRVVRVVPGGPAAKTGLAVGDRIVEVAGREVEDAAQVEATLQLARPDKPVRLKWLEATGAAAEADLNGNRSPLLISRHERLDVAMVRAAWAELDTNVGDPMVVDSALANLGLLFLEYGHYELAVDIWRRVDWGNRSGIGEGTKQYYLGRALEGEGREDDAATAYRKAAASTSTAFTDDGLSIALAARDRLADLGVAD
jgi:tetratricopeptide (TPR) repeat protein